MWLILFIMFPMSRRLSKVKRCVHSYFLHGVDLLLHIYNFFSSLNISPINLVIISNGCKKKSLYGRGTKLPQQLFQQTFF